MSDTHLPKKAQALIKELVTDKGKQRLTPLDRYRLIHETNMNWCSKTKQLLPVTEFDEDPNDPTGYKPYCRDAAPGRKGMSREDFRPTRKISDPDDLAKHYNRIIREGIKEGKWQRTPRELIKLVNEEHEGIAYSSVIQGVYVPTPKPAPNPELQKATTKKKTRSKKKRATRKKTS